MNKSNYFFFLLIIFFLLGTSAYAEDENTVTSTKSASESKSISTDSSVSEEEEGEEEGIEAETEIALDSIAVDSLYKDLIPANDLYAGIWSNQMVNPYANIAVDSILNDSTSCSIDLDGFHFPLKTFYRVTSNFGQRRRRYHYGIDLKIQRGDTVVSVNDGMVRVAKTARGYGNFVLVRHSNGLETVYGHLDHILVEPNQIVKAGEVIGLAGNTGRSTGPHLHFEFRFLGKPINPRDLIDFDSTLHVVMDTLVIEKSHFVYPRKSSQVKYTAHRPVGNDYVVVAENPNPEPRPFIAPVMKTAAVAAGSDSRTAIKPAANMKANGTWVVKGGDTLGHIATRTGTSISRLCALNGISRAKLLRIGQKILY